MIIGGSTGILGAVSIIIGELTTGAAFPQGTGVGVQMISGEQAGAGRQAVSQVGVGLQAGAGVGQTGAGEGHVETGAGQTGAGLQVGAHVVLVEHRIRSKSPPAYVGPTLITVTSQSTTALFR
ncbi:MAG: hypothetical protein AAFX06_15840 [Planctomycetota bacterium]